MSEVDLRWRGAFTSTEANTLHAEAFGTRIFPDAEWDWAMLCARHSLGWVTARDTAGTLIGFCNVLWDGLAHAWLQDVMVAAGARRGGLGSAIVAASIAGARTSGCEWLHVDFDPQHRSFYVDACGFTPTEAGVLRLDQPGSASPASEDAAP